MNWVLLIWIGVSMLFVGFFAGLQTAFGSLNRFSVELKKKQGVASGRILSYFIENQSRFIGALLVAVTLSLVVFVLLVNRLFDPLWKQMPTPIRSSAFLRITIELLTSGLLALLIQVVFKAIFRKKSNSVLSFFARTVSLL